MRALVALMVLAGCEVERPRPVEEECVTWERDVAPALSLDCSTCHSGARPAGGYDVMTYEEAIRTATAGDAQSRLLTKLGSDPDHPTTRGALLTEWVVTCELALRDSLIHPPGIRNPADPDFHGIDVDFPRCAECHGRTFNGGGSGSSCRSCHPQGPTDCSTCHRGGIDAEHRAHPYECETCHLVPERYDDPGHIDPPPAEVTVDCATIWCHGEAEPRWIAGVGEADCGTCHGLPPATPYHPVDDCDRCHQVTVHIDDVVQIGTTEEGCRGCHGTADQPAPMDRGHDRHLMPQLGLRGPVPCDDCHQVPETVTSDGHIDTDFPVELFPAAIAATTLAGPDAAWDPSTGTCEVYCHGPASPVWDGGPRQIVCDSCHGVPPPDPNHQPQWPVTECQRCHPVYGEEHLDGTVDLRNR